MPNIVICGTPGTGKSSIIKKLEPSLKDCTFINLSEYAIENDCISSYDDELDTHVIDEDKLDELIEPKLKANQMNIIESIHADSVNPELVNWVFVCRTENSELYDRLKARNYNEQKISNNIESEIFQTILDETKESFGDEVVTELTNNTLEDLGRNVQAILDRLRDLTDMK